MKKIMSLLFIAFAIATLLIVVKLVVMNDHSLVVIVPFAILSALMVYLSLDVSWGK